jgi:hypothetical protein
MMHGGVHPRQYKSPGTSCFWSFTHSISRSALELSSLTHSISPASLRRPRQVSAHRRSLFRPPLLCVYRFVLKSFRFFRWRTRIVSRFGGKRVVLERCHVFTLSLLVFVVCSGVQTLCRVLCQCCTLKHVVVIFSLSHRHSFHLLVQSLRLLCGLSRQCINTVS